jgi:2-(1,2-epoxy-1,2-dihydrophenyl)acetyl-CoA isomerase
MTVGYRLEGEVAIVTLSRPEKFNSVSADLSRGLVHAIGRADAEARALILTGEGKAFCAGADLADLMADYETGGPDLASVINDRFNPMVRALVDAPIPTIAAVNGVAAGAGLGLALACDLRVMSSQAFFLSAFIGLALIPDTGSTWMLVHHLGLARAIEFTATNRRMAADEVASLGLARIAEPEELLGQAVTLGADLATGPTTAYAANRKILFEAAASNLSAALEVERITQGELGRTALHLEGMRAFLEKRKPNFRT